MLGVVGELAVEAFDECEVGDTWRMGGVWNTGRAGKDREVRVETAKFQYLGPLGSVGRRSR